MATETILSNPFFTQAVFPFILVFVLVFAILEKSKILGEEKKQVDAIVSLVIALIFITFSRAVGIVVNLIPFLAVMAVIILVFYIMLAFLFNDKEFKVSKGIKIAGGIIVFVALGIAVMVVTGVWSKIFSYAQSGSSVVTSSVIMLVIVAGALAVVLATGRKKNV